MGFLVSVYSGFTCCTFFLETDGIRVPIKELEISFCLPFNLH